jgi:hypothetical protein
MAAAGESEGHLSACATEQGQASGKAGGQKSSSVTVSREPMIL